ncbi:MAG: hypothetical protein K1Y36_23000 [Blastocatellia bacterium]|nr:hypothetical protein [Blastocatellia bacterium]HMW02256.1 hypothetical protein [Acidobacteriota bacterium]
MSETVAGDSFSQQMMTLSALTYVNENKPLPEIKPALVSQLAIPEYATGGNWSLVWGPCQKDETMFFCVQERTAPQRLVLCVRGTDLMDFDNWVEDLWVSLVDYPMAGKPFDGHPKIAKGTLLGLNQLTEMLTAAQPDAWATEGNSGSLFDFLVAQSGAADLEMTVTGHSLGGCLAVMLAVWLTDRLEKATVSACTFAAPTPGETELARYTESRLGERHQRHYNQLDVIPLAWNNLEGFKTTPSKMGWMDEWFKLLLDGMIELTKGKNFAHAAHPFPIAREARSEGGWFQQAGYEHDYNTYLTILGAPTVKL